MSDVLTDDGWLVEGVLGLFPGEATRLHRVIDEQARSLLNFSMAAYAGGQLTPERALAAIAALTALKQLADRAGRPL
jgi:hypothetical protein